MFCAQAIGVAQACIEATQSATMAFADANHEANCDKSVNQNACLQQYTSGDQSSTKAEIAVAPMPALAVLSVPIAPHCSAHPAVTLVSLAHSHDPPASIRFCSFQL
jgi:hypothetical protein